MKTRRISPLLVLCWLTAASFAGADVTLPSLISDHAVLQRSAGTALWGKADPGERVSASIAGVSGETLAGPDGKWRLRLDLSRAAAGPFDLEVDGKNKKTVHDVVIGEVWVASGQSNMEFPLARAIGGKEEIAASANPMLRQFSVPYVALPTPQDECGGSWKVAGPTTSGDFTAVGYYFAKNLGAALHAPVGLIASHWGGTPVEAWISAEALDSDPDLRAGRARVDQEISASDALKAAYVPGYRAWEEKYERKDTPADPATFAGPGVSTADWQPLTLPGKLSAPGLPEAGAIWLRKTIPLHGSEVTAKHELDLTNLEGFETVYYNGRKVGGIVANATCPTLAWRHYFPAPSVEGDNVLAIRVHIPLGNAALSGDPNHFTFGPVPLKGEWLAKAEYSLPAASAEAKSNYPALPKQVPSPPNRPAALYNAMIHPLLAATIQGVVWYQGESNVGRAAQYRKAFPLMITDWRHRWGNNFSFYFCQLASYMGHPSQPGESAWAELREAQTRTLSLPNTGEAVLIDIGEVSDIHPRNKKDVGDRLASVALAKTYGRPVPFSGPVFRTQQVEGAKIRISFDDLGGGLVARPLPAQIVVSSQQNTTQPLKPARPGSEIEGFAICGEDRKWVWADAKIDGDTVVVSNPEVPRPVAVRYAWSDTPAANLYNKAGFPAGPFRTDTYSGNTDKALF